MNWEAQWEQGALLLFKRLPKVEWCLASGWKEIVSNTIVPSFPVDKQRKQSQRVHRAVHDIDVLIVAMMAFGQDMSCFQTRCKWAWTSDAKLEHRIYGDKLNLQFFFLFFFFFRGNVNWSHENDFQFFGSVPVHYWSYHYDIVLSAMNDSVTFFIIVLCIIIWIFHIFQPYNATLQNVRMNRLKSRLAK